MLGEAKLLEHFDATPKMFRTPPPASLKSQKLSSLLHLLHLISFHLKPAVVCILSTFVIIAQGALNATPAEFLIHAPCIIIISC
jgi:hypothetical protein